MSATKEKQLKKSCGKNMDAPFREFMEAHRVKKGEPFTHTSKAVAAESTTAISPATDVASVTSTNVSWPAGIYYIGAEDTRQFWTLYCNLITNSIFPTLTERPSPVGKPIGPLRVDFDLISLPSSGECRQYNAFMIHRIIRMYQDEVRKIIDNETFEDKMLMCILLEKPKARKETDSEHGIIIKDGFHLHFPHFICSAWTQDQYLREIITKRMIDEKIWSDVDLVKGVGSIIDTQIAGKMWMLYGSMNYKSKKSRPYLATKAYNSDGESISLGVVFEEEMEGRKSVVQYYLPEFLSIRGYDEPTKLSTQFSVRMPKPKQPTIIRTRSEAEVMEDIRRIKDGELLSLLSDDRVSDYSKWMDIGWTLFNIGQGCDEALQMWVDVSRRSPKFLEGECEDQWSKMEMRGKTMASLIKIVQEDNPEDYRKWQISEIDHCIEESLREKKPTECDVAAVAFQMYDGRFICTKSKHDVWYEFVNHRWRKIDDAHSIKKLLSEGVRDEYERYAAKLMDWRRGTQDEGEISKMEEKIKRCFKISHDLKTVAFHRKIIDAMKLRMYDDQFIDKLDKNPLLLGCENGIIDLHLNQFRPGRPDDYVSLTTGHVWIEYNPNDYQVIKLRDFFARIFTDKKLLAYFYDFFASCLEGGNIHKTILVCIGDKNNGKSRTFALLECAFGKYCVKVFPESIVAGRGQAGGTRADIISYGSARLGLTDELTHKDNVNLGAFKQMTGQDSIPARDLFKGADDIKKVKMGMVVCIQCNTLFKVPQDNALWDRLRILDFQTTFVKPKDLDKTPVPDDPEEQFRQKLFVADETINDNWITEMAGVLLWILVKHFPVYKSKGIKEPEQVRLSTESHRSQSDIFQQFVTDHLQRQSKDEKLPGSTANVAEAFRLFKGWYRDNYPSSAKTDPVNAYDFQKEISRRVGKATGTGRKLEWKGWSIIQFEDDDNPSDFFKK